MSSYLTNYPSSENYKESVFFWWVEFLKRSDSYRQQCEAGEGGEVYQDFGNIFDIEFLDWWNNDDRELLFLPGTSLGVWPVENVKQFKEAVSEEWLVVKIDPKCTRKSIIYWLDDLLFSHQPDVRGQLNHNVIERPKYETFSRPNVPALKKTLAIYDQFLIEPKPLYKIYDKLKNDGVVEFKSKDDENFDKVKSDDSTSRRIKTSTISRYIRQAENLIKNVEQGVFPKSY
jgi:hypothetical protein